MSDRSYLESISIRNLGIIEESELELGKGFNVLTGETGAGKTSADGQRIGRVRSDGCRTTQRNRAAVNRDRAVGQRPVADVAQGVVRAADGLVRQSVGCGPSNQSVG